ncbi:hypothetical protein RSSM_03835 [Rhodopirellula sallentina SM41]|uniref:Uncharacterized protein n=1 Tax=Rhodopirellula sallentina SM41 TaxID=1263870 RepID=M5U0F1_9BACT|nr:hypothetical protein RSSM_03835 [Rhodopirellula sallentina SM41]
MGLTADASIVSKITGIQEAERLRQDSHVPGGCDNLLEWACFRVGVTIEKGRAFHAMWVILRETIVSGKAYNV